MHTRISALRRPPLRGLMSGLCVAAFALTSAAIADAAPAGRVLMAVGEVVAMREGRAVRLQTGVNVEERDLLRTGPASHLQVRMSDESIIALKADSALSLQRYAYQGRTDGSENAIFRLLKGGFRTVTGLIGRVNRNNYKVTTGVATIGIRGTSYALALCDGGSCTGADGRAAPDGLYGTVTDGQVAASNQTGVREFGIGDTFYSQGAEAPFQRLLAPPAFLADRLEGAGRKDRQRADARTTADQGAGPGPRRDARTVGDVEVRRDRAEKLDRAGITEAVGMLATAAGNNLDTDGRTGLLPEASGFVVSVPTIAGGATVRFGDRDGAVFDAANRLLGFSITDSSGAIDVRGAVGAAGFSDVGRAAVGDVVFTWGRWNGGVVQKPDGTIVTGVPLLFGTANVTGASSVANLGNVGTVSYTALGGPSPIAVGLPAGAHLTNASLQTNSLVVDFTAAVAHVDLALNFGLKLADGTQLDKQFGISGSLSPVSGGGRTLGGGAGGLGDFAGSPAVSCTPTCTGYTSQVQLGVGGKDGYGVAALAGGIADGGSSFTASFLQAYVAPNASASTTGANLGTAVAGVSPPAPAAAPPAR